MLVTPSKMADTFFRGHAEKQQRHRAVGVSSPSWPSFRRWAFSSPGSGNFISRELGKQNYERGQQHAATGLFSAWRRNGDLRSGQLLPGASGHAPGLPPPPSCLYKGLPPVILFRGPWMTSSLVLNNQLRYQGSAAYAMVGIASGGFEHRPGPPADFHLRWGWPGRPAHHHQPVCQLLPPPGGLRQGGNLHITFSRVQLKAPYYVQIVRGAPLFGYGRVFPAWHHLP